MATIMTIIVQWLIIRMVGHYAPILGHNQFARVVLIDILRTADDFYDDQVIQKPLMNE